MIGEDAGSCKFKAKSRFVFLIDRVIQSILGMVLHLLLTNFAFAFGLDGAHGHTDAFSVR